MCGPLVLMMGLQLRARGMARAPSHVLYHGSRIAVYAILGAVIGTIGSLFGLGASLNRAAGVVSLALGLGVVVFGLGYMGWRPLGRIESTGAHLERAMSQALQRGGREGVILLGALNGLLPCGLVYSALLVSATTGGPLPGALGMVLFGLGTLPALFVVGMGAGALSPRLRQALGRVAGVVIVLVGIQLILRGLSALGVVPPLRLGGLVLW
jgi:sulfite exporter TauE/SafE